ncbi:tetratricopeptide repeat protein [Devosia lucknowensis]|nr:tetratricopeptide repeat protein [Devosia lucknowensis]
MALSVFLVAALPSSVALGQTFTPSATQSAELDALFSRLSASTTEPEARQIADRIWRIWTRPDDPVLAARVDEIIKGGGFAGPASQLPLIDALIEDYPDYPEGWNLRATAHFMRGAYDDALADVARTLALEPRHFGAMAGRALILHTQGKYDQALESIKQALDIHPWLPERSLFPELGKPPMRS